MENRIDDTLLKWVLSKTKTYEPNPYDTVSPSWVSKAIEAFIYGDKNEAIRRFKKSTLHLDGILYYTIRNYMGDKEEDIYLFLKKVYKTKIE